MPLFSRYRLAAAARRLPSARLYSSEPRSSACPLICTRTLGLAARTAALRSSVPWSTERTVAWSYSKLIMAARSALTALARSIAARARASSSRRARSALSSVGAGAGVVTGAGVGSGAGCSGAGFPPQAAASPAVARTNNREVARIRTPRSGLGSNRGPTQSAGPRREPRRARGLQLAHAAGFDVDDPELPDAAPVGDERDVPAVGPP